MTFRHEATTKTRQSDQPALSVHDIATRLLTDAPVGQLTVLNAHALAHHGGWAALGQALAAAGPALERDLLDCQFGDGPRHELTRQLTSDYNSAALDWDSDLHITAPDWESDAYDQFDPDDLAPELSPFGSASIPALTRLLARQNHMSGVLPVLLVDPAAARPYAAILNRQHLITDATVRAGALAATIDWLAADVAAFAAARPNAPTVVASDDRQPEWPALLRHAGVVLPES